MQSTQKSKSPGDFCLVLMTLWKKMWTFLPSFSMLQTRVTNSDGYRARQSTQTGKGAWILDNRKCGKVRIYMLIKIHQR